MLSLSVLSLLSLLGQPLLFLRPSTLGAGLGAGTGLEERPLNSSTESCLVRIAPLTAPGGSARGTGGPLGAELEEAIG